MASLFPGYELKIFSFRQKDFKGDKCAGEFIGDLKNRHWSEFKDGIDICFAISQQKDAQNNPAKYETTNLVFVGIDSQYYGCL